MKTRPLPMRSTWALKIELRAMLIILWIGGALGWKPLDDREEQA